MASDAFDYGASHNLAGHANLPSTRNIDSAHLVNYPALMAFIDNVSFSFNAQVEKTQFKKMDNIIVKNSLNSNDNSKEGDIDPNLNPNVIQHSHLTIPLIPTFNNAIGISVSAPITEVSSTESGEPFLPYYLNYQENHFSTLRVHYLQKIKNKFSFSLGQKSSFNVDGQTVLISRHQGDDDYSSAKMEMKAKPQSALIIGLGYLNDDKNFLLLFHYHDSLKTVLFNRMSGFTPLGDAQAKYNLDMSAQLRFDPRLYSLSFVKKNELLDFSLGLDYYDYSDFESPKLKLTRNNGIIKGTKDYEDITIHHGIVPRLGLNLNNESYQYKAGYFYQPRFIESNLNNNGNTIDTASSNYTIGLARQFRLLNWNFQTGISLLWKELEKLKVKKSSGMENDQSGDKIGANGYEISGSVQVITLGINWIF